MPPAFRPLALLGCLLLVACGSSSTEFVTVDSSPLADLFQGTYHYTSVSASEGAGSEFMRARWGSASANGISSASTSSLVNANGFLSGPVVESWARYAVEADRRFTIESEYLGVSDHIGGITETGHVAALAAMFPGSTPALTFLAKRGSGLGNGSIAGTYFFIYLSTQPVGLDTTAGWGVATFDGAGGGSLLLGLNEEGLVVGGFAVPLTYSIAGNGSIEIEVAGGLPLEGGVAAGGDVIVLGGAATDTESPQTWLMIRREDVGLTDADFEGKYFLVGMTQEIGSSIYTGFRGSFDADGLGDGRFRGLINEEGLVQGVPAEDVSTVVAPDGQLSVTTSGGDVLHGGITPDGTFAVFAGPATPGSNPSFFFLLR